MYQPRTPGYSKNNAEMRWALPDRVFFACGACHILAYAFLQRWGEPGMQAVWIKPAPGHTGNHVLSMGGSGSSITTDFPPSRASLHTFVGVLVNDGQDGTGRLSSFRLT